MGYKWTAYLKMIFYVYRTILSPNVMCVLNATSNKLFIAHFSEFMIFWKTYVDVDLFTKHLTQ